MATQKEQLTQSQKAFADFMQLSKLLFGEDAPLDLNEMPTDSPFYSVAKEIADEMDVDWEKMTHEESNSLMLNLLSDYFNAINTSDDYDPVLTISFKKRE